MQNVIHNLHIAVRIIGPIKPLLSNHHSHEQLGSPKHSRLFVANSR
jgi:hypothetical protein